MVKKTGYTIEQQLALELYIQNHTKTEIGKRTGKTRQTIVHWIDKFNWNKKKEKFRKKLIEKNLESNEEAKKRLIEVYRHIVTKGHEQITSNEINISLRDIIMAGQAEAKLRVLESNIEPDKQYEPITLNIIRPDEVDEDKA